MPDTEQITLEVDERPAVAAVGRANSAVEGHEKQVKTFVDAAGRKWESYGDTVVRVNDKSRSSLERLVQSMERQAAVYGKTGVDKLVAERDLLIKKWGQEEQTVKAITAAYDKMIAAESGGGGSRWQGFADNVKNFIQNPLQAAGNAFGSLLEKLGPMGTALSAGGAALGAFAVASFSAAKSLGEYGVQIRDVELRTGLTAKEVGQFGYAAKAAGADVSIFERLMRGLSQAMDENSQDGEKARAMLQRLHVSLYDAATGGIKPTSQALQEIGAAIAALPTAYERNVAAMALFKRAGMEAIPVMVELSANLATAKAKGYGPSDEDVDRFLRYQRGVAQVETAWAGIVRHLKEFIVPTFEPGPEKVAPATSWTGRLRNWLLGADETGKVGKRTGFLGLGTPEYWDMSVGHQPAPAPPGLTDAQQGAIEAALSSDTSKGALSVAQKALEKTQKDLASLQSLGAPWEKIAPVVARAEQEKSQVERMKQAAKDATEAAANRKKLDEENRRRRQELAEREMWSRQPLTETPEYARFEEYAYEQQRKQKINPALLGYSESDLRDQMEGFAAGERIDSIHLQSRADALNREAGRAQKMVGLSGMTGMDAIRAAYQIRIDLATQLAGIEAERIAKEDNAAKRSVDAAQAQAAVQKEIAEAQEEALVKRMELQKQQMDGLKKESEGLLHTLFTKPTEFPKQLASTIREAALKPVTEGLGGMAASALHPLIYGSTGEGGIAGAFHSAFGGGRKDLTEVTDDNTRATRQNSQAMYTMSLLLARAAGVSLSSLPIPASIPGFGQLPRFASGGITNGPTIVGEAGPELVIPLDMRPTPYRPLVGTYGPQTDAALQKAATGMFDLALPVGLTALGGPAGFSLGEGLMSLILGGAAAATPPRHDNLMLGMVPVGGGGSRFQRMQAGEIIGDEELHILFGKTKADLVSVGRKGGLASVRARRLRMAAGEIPDESMYTGPEIDRETTHQAASVIDDQFPWLRDAFKKDEGFLARQERGRKGGQLGGGDRVSAAVRAARGVAAMRVRGSTAGSMLWAINPDTGGVRLAPYIPDGTKWSADLFATHADWFEQIKFPVAGPEFDRIPRGYARINRGRLHITDNGIEETQEGLTSPPLTADQYRVLVERISKKFKLPSYDDGGTVAQTGMAVVHQGEAVVPSADTLKRAIDLNTAAMQKAAEQARANTMQMAGTAASVASWLFAAVAASAPAFAARGAVAPNAQPTVQGATGGAGGATGGDVAMVSDLAAVVGGPGYTSGYAGPVGGGVSGYGPASGGSNPAALLRGVFGRGASGSTASGGGVLGMLKNIKGTNWGGVTRARVSGVGAGADGSDVDDSNTGRITGVNGVAGAALFTGGTMLAEQGLLGSSRGTWGGMGEGAVGGAAIGFQQGGPLGAAIGGAIGLGIGLGEKLAGVESPENEAKRLVRQIYSIRIDNATAKQIVGIAQQKYASHVSLAVRDPDVRKMLMLYSEATGQKFPMSATAPQSASLAEMGGKLYQQASYVNGTPYTFQSNLPVAGGYATGNYPSSPSTVVLNVNGQSAADLLEGRVASTVTPSYVQSQWASAAAGSEGRLQNSAMVQQPGLVIS